MSHGGSSGHSMGSKGSGDGLANKLRSMNLGSAGGSTVARRGEMLHDFTRTRPDTISDKMGTSGTAVSLKANFVKMVKTCNSSDMSEVLIYQYHVSFNPSVDSKRLKQDLLDSQSEALGVIKPIFDGMIMYLPRKVRANKLYVKHPVTKEEVIINMEVTAELIPTDQQCTTFLNVTNRRVQEELGLIQIGRHFFDRTKSTLVPGHGMEIWPGFNSAIRRYEEDLLMNVDVVHKLLRRQSVLDFLEECLREGGARGKDIASKDLIGCSVLTKYNNKLYHVDDILWDKHPELTTFEKRSGDTINLVQYMKEQYAMDVVTKNQPLLLSRAKKRGLDGSANADLLLIPEMCFMTGLTERMRADTRVMRDVATKTRVGPAKRVESAEALCDSINSNPKAQALLKSWDLSVDNELVRVRGRVLPPECLIFGDNRETQFDFRKGEWSRESRGKKPVDGRALSEGQWALIFPQNLRPDAEKLYNTLKGEGPALGIPVALPVLKILPTDTEANYVDACREAVKMDKVQMIVAVVPNDNSNRYDAIKKTCFLEAPVPCQVVQLSTLKRENILRSICQKIINQINVKMGGALWRLKIPMKRIMIIGYDSYTDSSLKGKAVGAAVFSQNDMLTKWYSQAKLFEKQDTESQNIATFLEKALYKYKEANGCLPQRMFIYRDGVGEGQVPVVFNVELDLVKTAIARVYGPEAEAKGDVKLAFLIVNKKINTRFFAESRTGAWENPMPGTVVDTVVTRVERYDFFMVPQAVNQGSVTPVAYNVIYDKSGLSADQMQRLAFKLCHLYYNWQGTIRVPAPCQYAHKLAFITSQSTHAVAHEALHDTLYFL